MPIEDSPQKTNRQHAVPQNIMDVEFKIIGDLTIRQFSYLMFFGALSYGAFTQVNNLFKWPSILIFTLFGVGLAFVPIEERGLDQWIINFFSAIYRENQRIWRKTPHVPTALAFDSISVVKQELITLAPTSSRRKLENFLEAQEKGKPKDPLDFEEMEYIKKVRNAFYEEVEDMDVSMPSVGVGIAVEPAIKEPTPKPSKQEIRAPQKEEEQLSHQPAQKAHETPQQTAKTKQQKPAEQHAIKNDVLPKPQKTKKKKKRRFSLPKRNFAPLKPITPDQHSGRMFTSLLPKKGEIVLPIRGEKILKTSDEQVIEEDIKEKTQQLKILLEQIKQEEGIGVATTTSTSTAPQKEQHIPQPQPQQQKQQPQNLQEKQNMSYNVTPQQKTNVSPAIDANQALKKLQEENRELLAQIGILRQEISQTQQPQKKTEKIQKLHVLEQQQESKYKNYANIKDSLSDLKEKVFVKKALDEKPAQPIATNQKRANLVEGNVKNSNGVGLEGVVLIIKNEKEEPVRALKTDSLGHFAISTPLVNGVYTVETDKTNKTNLTFDIMKIETTGTVLDQLEILGKQKGAQV